MADSNCAIISQLTVDKFYEYLQVQDRVDLLIRTSGECRYSDFLLVQSIGAVVVFLDVLWPDFSWWHFVYCILLYQMEAD